MRKSKSVSSLGAVFKLTAIGVAATLVACGGGGGGGESTGSVTPGPIVVAPPPAVLDTSIVTSVPAATYAAGTGDRVAYDLLNAERQRCGLGLLAQNTKIDSAAAAHLKYSISNNTLTHLQDPTKPDFFGVGVDDRYRKVGYEWSDYTEDMSPSEGLNVPSELLTITNAGQYVVRRLLSAPYHSVSILNGFREVGFAISPIFGVINLAVGKGLERQNINELRTYPCEGTTGTHANSTRESPSPFPNENNPIWGHPVVVFGAADLRIASATVTGPSGSVPIKAIYGSGGTPDPNRNFTTSRAVVIPSNLKTNSTYNVTITGSNNGAPFTRTFSFSTGAYTADAYHATGAF